MKKILFILSIIFLCGCTTLNYNYYNVKLVDIKSPYETLYKDSLSFEDSTINIKWKPYVITNGFNFCLTNKLNIPLKIIWDDVSVSNENNYYEKCFHNGIKFSDNSYFQPNSNIIPLSKIEDGIFLSNYYHFSSNKYNSGWYSDNIFSSESIGKYYKILLPLNVNDNIQNYIFTFKIEK